eukprot:2402297-Prymnesium_polylepis.1
MTGGLVLSSFERKTKSLSYPVRSHVRGRVWPLSNVRLAACCCPHFTHCSHLLAASIDSSSYKCGPDPRAKAGLNHREQTLSLIILEALGFLHVEHVEAVANLVLGG